MSWKKYWDNLLETKKLISVVQEMDEVDAALESGVRVEEICRRIFCDYNQNWENELKTVKSGLQEILDGFQGVHLQTSRVKSVDSVLEKVITKRYAHLKDPNSLYSKITGDNYKDILTDLIGMRLIISYRGKWSVIHEAIVNAFPYVDDQRYSKDKLIPHSEKGEQFLAEIPKVYYAYGDDLAIYQRYNVELIYRDNGYRSVHYIISYKHTYIELQVRTIYDEAWSDCDHNYVYKHEENDSHSALKQISGILCQLTNISNDIGESMRDIYEEEAIVDKGNGIWEASYKEINAFDETISHLEKAQQELKVFREHLQCREGGADNG